MSDRTEIHMGFGQVAVGECRHPDSGARGLIYLRIEGAPREHDADCADIFPPGSVQEEYLAAIYFHTPEVLQQTIDVLLEMQRNMLEVSREQ